MQSEKNKQIDKHKLRATLQNTIDMHKQRAALRVKNRQTDKHMLSAQYEINKNTCTSYVQP